MASIEVFGSYGSLVIDSDSGRVLAVNDDEDASPAESYRDIERLDPAERRAWWAARGLSDAISEGHGDVLDFGGITKAGEAFPAALDWREIIARDEEEDRARCPVPKGWDVAG